MKQAVILAAGQGSRLGDASHGKPKCLADISGQTILELQLTILEELEIRSIVVVAGYAIDQVRAAVHSRPGVIVVPNERFAETNSLYSLWLIRDWVTGPFVCMNSDVLAHPDIFRRVLSVDGCALAFDSTSGFEKEHMKVECEGRYLRSIGKEMPARRIRGENVGLLQFDPRGAMVLFSKAGQIVEAGGEMHWAPSAVNAIAEDVRIRCVDISGLPWIEIDFPRDLEEARRHTWPSIKAALSPAVPERGLLEAEATRLEETISPRAAGSTTPRA